MVGRMPTGSAPRPRQRSTYLRSAGNAFLLRLLRSFGGLGTDCAKLQVQQEGASSSRGRSLLKVPGLRPQPSEQKHHWLGLPGALEEPGHV